MIKHWCHACGDSGSIVARHKVQGGLYAFRCGCNRNADRNRNYPTWSARHEKDFALDYETVSNVAPAREPIKAVFPKVDSQKLRANDFDDSDLPF
jgi:hypothetical protein